MDYKVILSNMANKEARIKYMKAVAFARTRDGYRVKWHTGDLYWALEVYNTDTKQWQIMASSTPIPSI